MGRKYETVIGLEVHVQLSTDTKQFCGCSTDFGAVPNTQVCPVCLGMPGVLPVLNKKAFEYSLKISLALDFDIQDIVKFDRKNYYYPDLPKAYQISQYDMPLAYNGRLEIEDENGDSLEIGITRAHMEEDAGKLVHDPKQPFSYVDLNRTGTPLLEIVSEPDIRSPEQAYRYLVKLKQIIKYLGVSDCNMEEGSLRCDANISIREYGDDMLGSKVEIKNLNSFKAVRDALMFEEDRQRDLLNEGRRISQETRLWDEKRNITVSMRSKEDTQDYRYFPEPDLVPFEVDPLQVAEIRNTLPELPADRKKRFTSAVPFDEKDIDFLLSEKEIADFYEELAEKCGDPQAALNWVKGEIMMHAKERNTDINGLNVDAESVAEIIRMAEKNVISGLAAKEVFAEYISSGSSPMSIVKEKGLEQVSDEGALDKIILQVISDNEKSVNDYKAGKKNALSFLVGQVMKNSKGKANPKLAGEMLKKRLEE